VCFFLVFYPLVVFFIALLLALHSCSRKWESEMTTKIYNYTSFVNGIKMANEVYSKNGATLKFKVLSQLGKVAS